MTSVSGSTTDTLRDITTLPPVQVYLRELWKRRDFVWMVPLGNLKAQTHSTVLGAGWHLLNPLLTAALYYLIFGVFFRAAIGVDNYAAFLVVGIFTFIYTSRTIEAGALSMTSNLGLLTQINFPRAALPMAATVTETISHGLAVMALLIILPILVGTIDLAWLLVVPILSMQLVFNLGAALVVARLAFEFHDLRNLLPHLLRFWMYLSGLVFSIEMVVGAMGSESVFVILFQANPGYMFMALMREALLEGHPAPMWMWIGAAGWAMFAVVGGFFFFRAKEREYGLG